MTTQTFKKIIYGYYAKHRRDFPWRETIDPYRILVSEIMLQQTQAPRVVAKYESFIKKFPDFKTLAKAPLARVLKEWQGLGYNRRGAALKKTAEIVMKEHGGKLPREHEKLLTLPGIGATTAGDILAFAWNVPVTVIETNIRTVYLHFFFKDEHDVHDKELLPLIEKTLDRKNPREWYYALMDYGAMLKKTQTNPSRRSRHYTKQSPFRGSNRELRSKILKYLLAYGKQPSAVIIEAVEADKGMIMKNLEAMATEGLLTKRTVKGVDYFKVSA